MYVYVCVWGGGEGGKGRDKWGSGEGLDIERDDELVEPRV